MTTLQSTFDEMRSAITGLARRWAGPRSELMYPLGDTIHHVCAALAWLDEAERMHRTFDRLDDAQRVVAHEAFYAVISLGQVVRADDRRHCAPPADLERAAVAVAKLLDALTPFVSRADDQLRRVLVDGDPIEAALDRLAG